MTRQSSGEKADAPFELKFPLQPPAQQADFGKMVSFLVMLATHQSGYPFWGGYTGKRNSAGRCNLAVGVVKVYQTSAILEHKKAIFTAEWVGVTEVGGKSVPLCRRLVFYPNGVVPLAQG